MAKSLNVSIVVPVYNVESTIKKCVDSILNQTYQPYEIILVDDGSTDSSGQICDELVRNNKIVKVIHKENAGLGYARNTGIENASGDSIIFLDSDDYFDQKLIENLVTNIVDPRDTVVSGYIRVDESGRELFRYKYKEKEYLDDAVKTDFLCRMMGSLPNKKDAIDMGATHVLYSLPIILENGVRFPSERVLISEDIIFNIHYYQYAKRVSLIESTDYYYVVYDNSLTHKYREDRFDKYVYLFEEESKLLKKYQLYDIASIRLKKTFFNTVKMSLEQEKRKISGKTFRERKHTVEQICNSTILQEIIQTYPIKSLGFSQRVFLYLLKFKLKLVLTFLVDLSVV